MPSWSFLGWITQIISRFDFKKPGFLDNLLVRLSTEYPLAVIYPFRLSYREFNDRNPNVNDREIVQQILNAIKNPMIEKFIDNICCICLPETVAIHHLKHILRNSKDSENRKKEFKICYDNVFGNVRGRSSSRVEKFKEEFTELLETNGELY